MSGITYDYDGRALYGYSLLGSKIQSVGENPYACVEVDRIANAAEWCSVVARGTFEQLHGADAARAVRANRGTAERGRSCRACARDGNSNFRRT